MPKRKDLVGYTYGELQVVEMLYNYNQNKRTYCRCIDNNGNEVIVRQDALQSGATKTTNGYRITDSCPVFTVTVNDRTQWNHITIVTTKTKVVVYVNG